MKKTNSKNFYTKILISTIIFLSCFSFIVSITSAADPVLIEPEKGGIDGSVYKLLAPIGSFVQAPDNIGDYFNLIFKIAIGLCGALAVVMIIIGGFQYMGDESIFGKTEAKSKIMSALFGLIIALGSYAILNTINPDLLNTGINVKSVSAEIAEAPILTDTGKAIPTGLSNTFADCPGGVRDVQVIGIGSPQHFIFCSAYASKLQQMFSDAYNANPRIVLTGGGFRTYEEQLQARTSNCPDPLNSPAEKCTPPTAKTGTSLHEQGLAVDLRCDGSLINWDDQNPNYTKNESTKKCFDWLKANASKYGFANLSSENWHWSVGPKAGH
ncbi:MAG TPA: D-alanyl-D-alanine carboxypeptidase family protein [Candidatus Paceibacterota bacterium]|nr:D-alanyl-D-alanine carboxypeptidase family protein [Candidatus Paceibacterota bacterium]